MTSKYMYDPEGNGPGGRPRLPPRTEGRVSREEFDEFHPFTVAQFIQGIVDKGKMKLGGTASFIDVELTIDEVRQLWAAAKHLEFMSDWGVGIEKTRFSLNECREWLDEMKKVAKESLRLHLDYVDIAILRDIATHVDRLGMMQEDGGKSSRKSKRR